MSTPDAVSPRSRWHEDLVERDRQVHDEENASALALEVAGLRRRNAELAAALAQARAGNDVRDSLVAEVAARLEEVQAAVEAELAAERGRAEEARAALDGKQAELDAVLGSVRWRVGGAASSALRAPVRAVRRLGAR